jgi:hypothetical protein
MRQLTRALIANAAAPKGAKGAASEADDHDVEAQAAVEANAAVVDGVALLFFEIAKVERERESERESNDHAPNQKLSSNYNPSSYLPTLKIHIWRPLFALTPFISWFWHGPQVV